jgi:hypothetical protein
LVLLRRLPSVSLRSNNPLTDRRHARNDDAEALGAHRMNTAQSTIRVVIPLKVKYRSGGDRASCRRSIDAAKNTAVTTKLRSHYQSSSCKAAPPEET